MKQFEELQNLDPGGKMLSTPVELPTPHKIAVLVLMRQFLQEKKFAAESGLSYPPQLRRNFCMLLLRLIQYPDMNYSDFHNILTAQPYKIDVLLLESFEKAMSEMFSLDIEAFFDFADIQNFEKMLCDQLGVSPYSIMGVYIRRAGIVLERLNFAEMMSLYRNMCMYYERGIRAMAIGPHKMIAGGILHHAESPKKPRVVEISVDSETTKDSETSTEVQNKAVVATSSSSNATQDHQIVDRNPLSKWSPKQAKLFVNQQIERLESNEHYAMLPKELQQHLTEIIQDNPLLSAPYFLSYMNQLRVHDYYNAMDALHRAFDRSPVRMLSQEKGLQYFCESLAILHAHFGHINEAMAALRESIMLSQENNDKRALSLANTSYSVLTREDTQPIDAASFATEGGGNAVAAGTGSSLGTNNANSDPAIMQANILSLQNHIKLETALGASPLELFDMLNHADVLTGSNYLLENDSELLCMRSAVWSVYGRHEMSSLCAQLLVNMKKKLVYGELCNLDGVANSISSLALWIFLQGEKKYANILLNNARRYFPRYPHAEKWVITELQIRVHYGIYRCRWHDALKACDQLYILNNVESMILRASVLVAKRYYEPARTLLEAIENREENLPLMMRIRILMLYVYCSLADNEFTGKAVTLLLTILEETARAHMDLYHALADMLLAQVLLILDMPQKAYETMKNCMDIIYTNAGLYDRAKTDFVYVRCFMAIAGDDVAKQKLHLQQSVSILERAISAFKKLEAHAKALDIYVYLSKTFNTLADRDLRNKYAGEFRRYYTEHPIPREYLNMMF